MAVGCGAWRDEERRRENGEEGGGNKSKTTKEEEKRDDQLRQKGALERSDERKQPHGKRNSGDVANGKVGGGVGLSRSWGREQRRASSKRRLRAG